MAVFEGKKSSNDIIINDRMSEHEVVASDVLPRYLFSSSLHLVISVPNFFCLPSLLHLFSASFSSFPLLFFLFLSFQAVYIIRSLLPSPVPLSSFLRAGHLYSEAVFDFFLTLCTITQDHSPFSLLRRAFYANQNDSMSSNCLSV